MTEQKNHEDARSHEIDFSDPQVVEAWLVEVDTNLDESDRQALAEEISRQFRRSPAGVPTSGLESEYERSQERLSWVLQQLETQESPEVRSQVGQLTRTVCERHRISEEANGRTAARRSWILRLIRQRG